MGQQHLYLSLSASPQPDRNSSCTHKVR
jgi:hypothetical protein